MIPLAKRGTQPEDTKMKNECSDVIYFSFIYSYLTDEIYCLFA